MDAPATTVEVMNVKSMEFDIVLKMEPSEDLDEWVSDLKRKYLCIEEVKMLWGENDPTSVAICGLRIILDEDTDYQQLCALRAELKA